MVRFTSRQFLVPALVALVGLAVAVSTALRPVGVSAEQSGDAGDGGVGTAQAATGSAAAEGLAPADPVVAAQPGAQPRLAISDLVYEGAFRIQEAENDVSSISYSNAVFALAADGKSFFIEGHVRDMALAEYALVEPSMASDVADLPLTGPPIQPFTSIVDRVPAGNPQNVDRYRGMLSIGDSLIVNGFEYYDAPGDNTNTTISISNTGDLGRSPVSGWAEMTGAYRAGGWLSPVPAQWQDALGGTHISGSSSGYPIISRSSVGPSAFVVDLDPSLGAVGRAEEVLGYSLQQPLATDLSNDSGGNDLWTHMSRAVYGFVVPGTSTYLTIGRSAGHVGGISYGESPHSTNKGYYPNQNNDVTPYYWLWDVNDMVSVRQGAIAPHQVRPYDHGPLDLPFAEFNGGAWDDVGGAAFDPVAGKLMISLARADNSQGRYTLAPLMLTYSIAGSGSGGTPTEPSDPVDLIDPTDPVDPPVEPGDPTKPVDPADPPTELGDPVDPPAPTVVPDEPGDPVDPPAPTVVPSEPGDPVDPPAPTVDPVDPVGVGAVGGDHCPAYERSPLHRDRTERILVGPGDDWERILADAGPDTEILMVDGEYRLEGYAVYLDQPGITIRSATGDREAVVIRGRGYGVEAEGLMVAANDVTIADLTMTGIRNHAISIKPEAGAGDVQIYNVNLVDNGTQQIKASAGGVNRGGVVACSSIGYTPSGVQGDYIAAVDLHRSVDWVIRDNYIYNVTGDGSGCEIDIDCGTYVSHPAILVWNDARGTIIERNTIVDSWRGISLGLDRGHEGGVVRNNFIWQSEPGDAGIELWGANGVLVEHNTVIGVDYPGAIEYGGSADVTIRNNLVTAPPLERPQRGPSPRATVVGNIGDATVADLAGPRDVRLREGSRAIGVGVPSGLATDIEGKPRGDRVDVGAHHFS